MALLDRLIPRHVTSNFSLSIKFMFFLRPITKLCIISLRFAVLSEKLIQYITVYSVYFSHPNFSPKTDIERQTPNNTESEEERAKIPIQSTLIRNIEMDKKGA